MEFVLINLVAKDSPSLKRKKETACTAGLRMYTSMGLPLAYRLLACFNIVC